MTTLHIIVDVGASVRWGTPRPIDGLFDEAAAAALDGLARGDRVALTLFDHRLVDDLPAGRGAGQRRRILEALVDAAHPVDDDLTAISDSELVERLAELARLHRGQETVLTHIPPLEDARWQHLVATPTGRLIDVARLDGLLSPEVVGAVRLPRASSVDAARLRHYCRQAGIPLPPRTEVAPERGAALALALTRSAEERGHRRIVVWSDFEGLKTSGQNELERAIRLLRRRGHRLTLRAPLIVAPDGVVVSGDDDQALRGLVGELSLWERRTRRLAVQQELQRLGLRLASGAISLVSPVGDRALPATSPPTAATEVLV